MSEFEERVAVAVKQQTETREVTVKQIAEALGMIPESVRRRHRKEVPWTLAELEVIGKLTNLDPSAFTTRT